MKKLLLVLLLVVIAVSCKKVKDEGYVLNFKNIHIPLGKLGIVDSDGMRASIYETKDAGEALELLMKYSTNNFKVNDIVFNNEQMVLEYLIADAYLYYLVQIKENYIWVNNIEKSGEYYDYGFLPLIRPEYSIRNIIKSKNVLELYESLLVNKKEEYEVLESLYAVYPAKKPENKMEYFWYEETEESLEDYGEENWEEFSDGDL